MSAAHPPGLGRHRPCAGARGRRARGARDRAGTTPLSTGSRSALALPPGSSSPRVSTRSPSTSPRARSASCRFACAACGGCRPRSARSGSAPATASGLVRFEGRVDRRRPLRVYPAPERLRRLITPAQTQAATGSEVSPMRAEGLEFADTRPFVPGDRVRSVNWRATARRGSLVVNERHPERNTDVVIFLDSFAEARATDRGDARAGRPRRRDARVTLPRAARSGRPRRLRRDPALAPARRRARAALSPRRRAARDRRRVQLRLEGRQHHPRADAAGRRARRRPHAASRRAVRDGARRPARARPRPRRARGVARAVPRPADGRGRATSPCASGACSGRSFAPASSASASPSRRSTT